MKEFSCGDVVPGCKAEFRADSDDELLAQVAAHAREGHGIHPVSDELASEVKRHIRTTANA